MSLASNSPPPTPTAHTSPFFSLLSPASTAQVAGRCPAGPQIRSSGFLHPDRSLLLASLPSLAFPRLPPWRAPSRSASLPSGRPARRWGTPSRPLSRSRLPGARGQKEPPAGSSSQCLRDPRCTPTTPSHLPPPFSRDPSRVRAAFARCMFKRGTKICSSGYQKAASESWTFPRQRQLCSPKSFLCESEGRTKLVSLRLRASVVP